MFFLRKQGCKIIDFPKNSVDNGKLQHFDELEDYPRLYGRREEEIIMDENQKVVYCIKLFFSFR